MKHKILALVAALLLILGCLSGCGSVSTENAAEPAASAAADTAQPADVEQAATGPVQDSHINVALFTYIEGMDPAVDWCGWNLTRCGVGETLVTVDENMKIAGQLADSWEQADDVTYRFHIRQGVQFSNGTVLTPEIVKASIERSVSTNSRGESLKLAGIDVEGEDVIFTTNEPFSAFLSNLTEPMCCIVDTTVDTSNYASIPICTGPYYITEYVSEEKIELAANENYWNGAPEIKTITALNIDKDTKADAILAGDIDVAQGPAATTLLRLEGNTEGIDLVTVTGTREVDYTFNCAESSPLSDEVLRQALSYAVDRDVIAQIAGSGYASALGTAFPASVDYNSDQVTAQSYDLEKAKALLAEKSYTDTDSDGFVEKDGEKLTLTISLSSSSSSDIAEALQNMWESIGVDIEIEMLENVNDKRDAGDFDIIAGGWQTVNAGDGQKYLAARWATDGTDNYGKYSSEAYDAVMTALDGAFDSESRLAAFVEAQQILANDCPCVWLYANDNVTVVNSNKVGNVTMFPIDYYLITNVWTLAE